MPEKRIVCLANSRKMSGRCIAGKVTDVPYAWVRPVSERPHQEVSETEREYQDGSDPRVLDIIDVPLLQHLPNGYQQENWLLDKGYYWSKAGTASWGDLIRMQDQPHLLWVNGDSTQNGFNDQIVLSAANQLTSSLYLIHVDSIDLRVLTTGAGFGTPRRRVQGRFVYRGSRYWLWVTDPILTREVLSSGDERELGECLLTISLGEAFNNHTYKLIAAVIQR